MEKYEKYLFNSPFSPEGTNNYEDLQTNKRNVK